MKLKMYIIIIFLSLCNIFYAQCWFNTLANDLTNAPTEFKSFIKNNENGLLSYNLLSDHPQLRMDIDLLEATSSFQKNHSDYMTQYPNQFQKIIQNLSERGIRCKTCTNGTNTGIPMADVVVENMDWALSRFKDSDVDIQKLLTEMAAGKWKADGGSYMLNMLRTKSDDYLNSISKFEFKYLTDGQYEADISRVLPSGKIKLEEYKSYSSSTWGNFLSTESSISQLKAYIQSGNDFEYFANITKLQDIDNPLELVKKQFQKVIKDNAKSLFQSNPNFFKKYKRLDNNGFIDDWEDLYELANSSGFLNNSMLNFIKVM